VFGRLAVIAALAAAVVAAQEPPRPTFRTEANYVRVDAYPTKDGAPVTDLTREDFAILEDGAPQRIEQFEHVEIRGGLPQELRREPNTVAESRAAIQNPRARVFVVFLDVGHVDIVGSHNIRQPLVDALNKLIGEDDLVAVMTPDMSPLDLAFARRTTTIESFLEKHWDWGDRDRLVLVDAVEKQYEACFGPYPTTRLTQTLVNRRREKIALDALTDLVTYLRGAREERKAVIAITDGWLLYRPDNFLDTGGQPPSVGLNPGTGKLQIGDNNVPGQIGTDECVRGLMFLSQIDDDKTFRELLDKANAANTSFYPLDPRGLAVFDTPINQAALPSADAPMLRQRAVTLRTLAENTDGLAMVNSNDLAGSFRKIVNDLSSYYLLGYYSTGKLDGRFHSIAVRIRRPGVQVRARRGYLAGTPAAAKAAATAAGPAPAVDVEAAAVAAAVGTLAGYARELPLRVQAAVGWKPGTPPVAGVWIEGELSGAREFEDLWKGGAVAAVELAPVDGPSLASARATIAAGTRAFRLALASSQPLAPGDYVVRTGARSTDAAVPARDTMRITIPPSPRADGAIWIRRGPPTANRDTPTADLRFRRNEQVRVEIPTLAANAGAARLLDRTGKALAIPVAAGVRDDADGSRWMTAQLTLAPLAAGDYVLELANGNDRMLAAFRVVP
jgi:VWFA-related protein